MTWQDLADCASQYTSDFYTENRADNIKPAVLNLCRTCPVQTPCHLAGMAERFGVWGGVKQTERERLFRRLDLWPDLEGADVVKWNEIAERSHASGDALGVLTEAVGRVRAEAILAALDTPKKSTTRRAKDAPTPADRCKVNPSTAQQEGAAA